MGGENADICESGNPTTNDLEMLEVIYSLRMGKGINGSSASADAQSQLTS